jgi:hypothetical protein
MVGTRLGGGAARRAAGVHRGIALPFSTKISRKSTENRRKIAENWTTIIGCRCVSISRTALAERMPLQRRPSRLIGKSLAGQALEVWL